MIGLCSETFWYETRFDISKTRFDISTLTHRHTPIETKPVNLSQDLSSPTLIPFIKNISHLSKNYINTDHATVVIDLDFTNTSRGKGTFRSPPNAHNDPTYIKLIKKQPFTAVSNQTPTPTLKLAFSKQESC